MTLGSVGVGSLAVVAAAALWGLWPLWIRGGVGGGATAVAAFVVSAAVGLPLALREGRGRRRAALDWGLLVLLGVIDAGNVWCYFRALDEAAVAPAVLSHYLAPVLVALVAPLVLREPRAPRTSVALLLAVAGTAALVLGGGGAAGFSDGRTMLGLSLGGASAIFYATMVLMSKRLASRFGDAELLCYHILVSAAVIFAIEGGTLPPLSQLVRPAIGGLVSTLVAGMLYYYGLRRIPAERTAILSYLEPPAAMLVGWLAFGEFPALAAWLGGALILAGGLLVAVQPEPAAAPAKSAAP